MQIASKPSMHVCSFWPAASATVSLRNVARKKKHEIKAKTT